MHDGQAGPPPNKQGHDPLRDDQRRAPDDTAPKREIEDHPQDIDDDQSGSGLGPI